MTRRIVSVAFAVCMIFIISGCAKVTRREFLPVEAYVADAVRHPGYYTTEHIGSETYRKWHPDRYTVTVLWNGKEWYFNEPEDYFRYFADVGKMIWGIVETRYYDDGSTYSGLIELHRTEKEAMGVLEAYQ